MRSGFMVAVGAAVAVVLAAAGPPPGATNCSGCHGTGVGAGMGAGAVVINGRDAAELTATMLAYRSGERAATLMGRLMKGMTPEQIEDVAVWVAAQK